jgi:tetratricopeptide (TPR) repeat protein
MKKILSIALSIISLGVSQAQTLDEAKRKTDNEQFEVAGADFRQLVQRMPQNGEYWFYYGENYYKSESLDSALVAYQSGVQNAEKSPLNYVGLGKIALENGEVAEAEKHFSKAKELGKKDAEVLIRIAEAYILAPKKDLQKAFQYLGEAEKLAPKNPEIQILNGDAFLENNDGSSAIKFYEKAQSLDPKSPKALLRIGQLWTRARNYVGRDGQKGALDYYKEAIAVAPDFAPAYRELGELYAKAQRYQEAKENYGRFLELSSKNMSAKVRYASFLYLSKEYNEAIQQIKEIRQIDTTRNLLNRIAGYAHYELKQFPEGIEAMERFFRNTKVDKIIPSDHVYYGKLLLEIERTDEGIAQLRKAFELEPENADLLTDLALIYTKLRKFEEAIDVYSKKVVLGKAGVNDYFRLGQSYYNIKEYGKADTAFSYVTEKQPKLAVGYFWRARANSGIDPESKDGFAKPHYENFISIAEEDTEKNKKELIEAYSYLGYFYYITKEYTNSRDFWEKVKALDPENVQAKEALADLKTKIK